MSKYEWKYKYIKVDCHRYRDLIGKSFNRLTVVSFAYIKNNIPYWYCKCSCGNIKVISEDHINKEDIKSCGCLKKETAIKNGHKNKRYNNYDLSGEYGIGYDKNGNCFYFDKEDYNKIKNYCWCKNNRGYFGTTHYILLHRLIMNCPKDMVIDHYNGIKYDNRKSNLNIRTQQENCWNQHSHKKNTSGYIGVCLDSRNKNKFRAYINYKNKQISLGSFDNLEDAINARKEAEIKYYGKYRYKPKEDCRNIIKEVGICSVPQSDSYAGN